MSAAVGAGEGGSVSGIMDPHPPQGDPLTWTWKKTPWEVLQPGLWGLRDEDRAIC